MMQFDKTIRVNDDNELESAIDFDTLVKTTKLSVDPDLYRQDEWTSWTPGIYTGVGASTATTVGNGQFSGEYIRIGDIVFFYSAYFFGSTTSFGNTGTLRFTYPVVPARSNETTLNATNISAVIRIRDDSASSAMKVYLARPDNASTTSLFAGTNAAGSVIAHNAPFTFAVNDRIGITGWFRTYST